MFGIVTEIEILPVPVAGENMGGFVEGLGLLTDRQREFRCHNRKQQSDPDHESNTTRCIWLLIGHVPESNGRKNSLRDISNVSRRCAGSRRGIPSVSCFEHGRTAETQDSGLFLLPASQLPGEVIQYLRSEFTTRHIPLPQGGIGITTKG